MPCEWLTVPCNTNEEVPIIVALVDAGICRWSNFILLTKDQVNNLPHQSPTDSAFISLSILQKHMLMITPAMCHHASRLLGVPMDPMCATPQGHHMFRERECNSKMPVINWKTPKPAVVTQEVTQEAPAFLNLTRLSPTDGWRGSQ
jgi:hypothetical protein